MFLNVRNQYFLRFSVSVVGPDPPSTNFRYRRGWSASSITDLNYLLHRPDFFV